LIDLNVRPSVHPNPVNGNYFYVSTGQSATTDVQLYLFDLTGKLVLSEDRYDSKSVIQVNVSQLKKGLYILKVVQNNQTFNYKILR